MVDKATCGSTYGEWKVATHDPRFTYVRAASEYSDSFSRTDYQKRRK